MRLSYLFLSSIVGALSMQTAGDAPVAPPRVVEVAPATQPVTSIESAISQMRQSSDPTAIIDAYSAGLQIDRDNIALRDAYVQRMVQLDMPGQATSAAERLLELQPNNGLARVVVANDEAQSGEMTEALTDLAIAAPKVQDNVFAQQSAARMLAWYDNAEQKPPLPDAIKSSLEKVRHDWQDLVTYRTAYQEAMTFYKQQQQQQAAQPNTDNAPNATSEPAPSTSTDDSSMVTEPSTYTPRTYDTASSSHSTYTDYSSTAYTPAPDYGYYTYRSYGWAYPTYPYYYYPGVIFVGSGHHSHHGDHDHDGHHNHDGDHDGHHYRNHDGGNRNGASRDFVGPRPPNVNRSNRNRSTGGSTNTTTSRRPASPAPAPTRAAISNNTTTARPAPKPTATPARPRQDSPAKPAPTASPRVTERAAPRATPSASPRPSPPPQRAPEVGPTARSTPSSPPPRSGSSGGSSGSRGGNSGGGSRGGGGAHR